MLRSHDRLLWQATCFCWCNTRCVTLEMMLFGRRQLRGSGVVEPHDCQRANACAVLVRPASPNLQVTSLHRSWMGGARSENDVELASDRTLVCSPKDSAHGCSGHGGSLQPAANRLACHIPFTVGVLPAVLARCSRPQGNTEHSARIRAIRGWQLPPEERRLRAEHSA